MLKKIILAALCVPLLAFGQSYPSPTFNNVTSQGTATLTNATVSGTLSVTGAPSFTLPVPVASGGTNCSAASGTCLDNITGFASTGFLTRTGTGAYAFQSLTNGVTYANLAQAGANTLLGNATGSTANVTAVAVSGCNGAAQALQWTNGSGFGCNSGVATSGANTNITSLAAGTTLNTPTITGVTGGACASAGNVGECKNSTVLSGSAVSLTSNTAANVTSVSLTAGNWLCYGNVAFLPGATTVTSQELGWISTTSAAVPTASNSGAEIGLTALGSGGGGNADILPVGMLMINVSTTTTAYLSAYATFTTSTNTAYGYINCIRWH